MGSILGGDSGDGSDSGGLLQKILDPAGIFKMLGGQQQQQHHGYQGQGMGGPPPPSGAQFGGQPPASGASFNPSQVFNSPMGPTGFGVGGGNSGRR